jgi:uncharacterized protein (DUF427 family)
MVSGHPSRAPGRRFHQIEVTQSGHHLRVLLGGALLAETRDPLALSETGLPVRWYIRPQDVMAELERSATSTHCPFKGDAGYYSVRLPDGRLEQDLIWVYEQPLPEVEPIAGRLCFFNERVDLELDGERQ